MKTTPELEDAIIEVIDWLDYVPSTADDLMPDIRRLRGAYAEMKYRHLKEKIHPVAVTETAPSEELGRQLLALRYDLLTPVIKGMIKEADRQAAGDKARGRIKLSAALSQLQLKLTEVLHALDIVNVICEKHIAEEINRSTDNSKDGA